MQDAAYGTLLRSRRQQLHARITAVLESQFPEIVKTHPEVVALHCAEASLTEPAVGYWLEAGRQAIAKCAMAEAVAQLRKGLDLLSGVPDSAPRQEQEVNLHMTLGHALIATKGYSAPESGEAFARSRQLCEQLNQPGQLGPILHGQFVFRFVRGDLHQAEHHAEEMRHLGEAQNDVRWKHAGSVISGVVCTVLGKFVDARAHAGNALSLWEPTFRAFAASPSVTDLNVMTRLYLFRTLLCLGYVDQARLRRDEAVAEARRLSPFNLAYALCLAWIGGDWAIEGMKSGRTMLLAADDVLAISREQGFPLWFAFGNIIRGWCLGTLSKFAQGIPLSLQGLVGARATGCKLVMPFFLTTLAELYGMAGQPKEGLARLAEAAELLETTQERWSEAEIHRLRGTCCCP